MEHPNSTPMCEAEVRSPWHWCVVDDYAAMSRAAAAWLGAEVRRKPASLISLATGSSPEMLYALLVGQGRREPLLYAQTRWLKLDEWGGLAMDDPATCEVYLRRNLLAPLDVPPANYFGWESRPADPQVECHRVAAWLKANGPIDIQVLGLGVNGHLGFNEPSEALQAGPHVAKLAETSLAHSMLTGSRAGVRYGLTLGMGNILEARKILLLVSGRHKAAQLQRLNTQPPAPQFPASMLQGHPAVGIFCDREAASSLPPDLTAFQPQTIPAA